MASKRSSSPPPPAWGRGLHAFAERFGNAVAATLRRVAGVARHGSIAIPHLRRGTRLAIGSARGRHGSLAMIGVWFITIVAALGLLVFLLSARTPGWFRTINPHDAALRDLAQRVENRVITQLYKYRGEVDPTTGATGEPWELTLTQDEATAWLSCKLPDWVRNLDDSARWPPEVSSVQASFGSSRIWIAAAVDNGSRSIVSLGASPRLDDEGLRLVSARAGVGSLTLPISWLSDPARTLLDRPGGAAGDRPIWPILTGTQPALRDASLRLEDGRRVRVVAVQLQQGRLSLTCQTLATPR